MYLLVSKSPGSNITHHVPTSRSLHLPYDIISALKIKLSSIRQPTDAGVLQLTLFDLTRQLLGNNSGCICFRGKQGNCL